MSQLMLAGRAVALLSTALQPQSAAWLPVCAVPIWMWLLGTGPNGAVEGWAVLLHPSNSPTALAATLVVFTLGVAAYWGIRAPGRSQGSPET